MSHIDLAILAILALSTLLGISRGFIKEGLSLSVWIFALLLTLVFTSRLALQVPVAFQNAGLRTAIAAGVLFFGSLFTGGIVVQLLHRIFELGRAGFSIRLLGAGFGLARGIIIVTIMVLLFNLDASFKLESWWQDSRLVHYFQYVAERLHRLMPAEFGKFFDFDTAAGAIGRSLHRLA